VIVVLTYVIAALVVGLYIWWFVRRYRKERVDKALESEQQMPSMTGLLRGDPVVSLPPPSPLGTPTASPPPPPPVSSSGGGARTVAEALAGIRMPHDLVPLTTIPHRPGVVDQVAFSSHAPVDVIGPLFADELERLGYAMNPLDERSLAAMRGNDNLVVYIHPEPVGTAPDGTVTIEVCVPY